MQAHMEDLHYEMTDVLLEWPLVIMKVNPATRELDAQSHIPKPKLEWTTEDRRRNNLDSVAKDILFKSVDDTIFSHIKNGKTAKEVWDNLMVISEGDVQQKDNKLTMAYKCFEDFKMRPGESITGLEAKLLKIVTEIKDLGKGLSKMEIFLKVLKVTTMRDQRDLYTKHREDV